MQVVGYIDREKFRCIAEDIITEEVIITDIQIKHIMERHPGDYERFQTYFSEMVAEPDYILEANKPNSGVVLKEICQEDEVFKLILRLATSTDDPSYKNSIITFMKIDEKEWARMLRNKKILYKRE